VPHVDSNVVTLPEGPIPKSTTIAGVVLVLVAVVVAALAVVWSLWLWPPAGAGLVAVGWFGARTGVPKVLAYTVLAIGAVLLALSIPAFLPA